MKYAILVLVVGTLLGATALLSAPVSEVSSVLADRHAQLESIDIGY